MPENTPTPDHHPHTLHPHRRPSPRPSAARTVRSRPARSQPEQPWTRRAAGPADLHDWEIADLVAVGVLDAVTGQPPVPISVWRATGPGEPPATPGALFTGLTPRVVAILLAIYTDPGDLIIDATADPTVEGAAGAGGRLYRHFGPADGPVDGAAGPSSATSGGLAGGAGLILLRWPSSGTPRQEGRQADQELLDACARLLSPDGHTVAILAPPTGGIYRDHARTLIAAASRAGLGYLQHVVVITGYPPDDKQDDGQDTGPDQNPDDDPGADLDDGPGASGGESSREHLDLLVLVLSPSRPAGARSGPSQQEPR